MSGMANEYWSQLKAKAWKGKISKSIPYKDILVGNALIGYVQCPIKFCQRCLEILTIDASKNYKDNSMAGQKSLLERYGLKNGNNGSIRWQKIIPFSSQSNSESDKWKVLVCLLRLLRIAPQGDFLRPKLTAIRHLLFHIWIARSAICLQLQNGNNLCHSEVKDLQNSRRLSPGWTLQMSVVLHNTSSANILSDLQKRNNNQITGIKQIYSQLSRKVTGYTVTITEESAC